MESAKFNLKIKTSRGVPKFLKKKKKKKKKKNLIWSCLYQLGKAPSASTTLDKVY
jgi:hypothetical protein